MIISMDIDYAVSNKDLLVQVEFPNTDLIINLNRCIKKIDLEFELPVCNQTIDITFSCNDLCIVDHPLTITNIVLDKFYQSVSILYRGKSKFNQQFLLLAERKKIKLDSNITDTNRLDFTGQLIYTFVWPFYKNTFND
jgi:hypothetical protein